MLDKHNRNIDYLRISLTEACNFKCTYCKDYDDIINKPLSQDIYLKIIESSLKLGINKFKITGGEPMLYPSIIELLTKIKQYKEVKQVTITTNGSFNKDMLDKLKDINIDGINFSLDTVNKDKFIKITNYPDYDKVINNIIYSKEIKIHTKINTVLLDEISYEDIHELIEFSFQYDIPIRFIELMPMKNDKTSHKRKQDIIDYLSQYYEFEKTTTSLGNGPATYYKVNDHYIGFIEPIHGKFCHLCNRVRLTSNGKLKTCLFHNDGKNLLPYLDDLENVMRNIIYDKHKQHYFEEYSPHISMSKIGG